MFKKNALIIIFSNFIKEIVIKIFIFDFLSTQFLHKHIMKILVVFSLFIRLY